MESEILAVLTAAKS